MKVKMIKPWYATYLSTHGTIECQNIFISMDGTIKPSKLNFIGMGFCDGQIIYKPKKTM